MHFCRHQVLVFNLPQRDQNLKTNTQTKKKTYTTSILRFKKQATGAGSSYPVHYLSGIIAGYIQLWVLASVALDTGEKTAGDLYELLWLWQRRLCKKTREEELVLPASTAPQFLLLQFCSTQINSCQIWPIQKLFSLHKSSVPVPSVLCRFQISSISTHSSHIYLWHSPTLYQIFLLFHFFDILLCIHLPLPLHYLLFQNFFPIIFIFLSHALRGSSVIIIIIFGLRMSFHPGSGRDGVGGSSGQDRVLVSRTMWLCSRVRPYWRRTSGDTVCTFANIIITQR